ncbi:hypothetical protein XELAEV_18016348mg [Xenopus laevis]|uniref:Uncharacterized protein n=1 Tax=Xenopus laevis TaxID=8355 RepID=A0A974DM96_XENLA|nr:hypothetical protein XELAEV_18016348mg [Xenopus laevis]
MSHLWPCSLIHLETSTWWNAFAFQRVSHVVSCYIELKFGVLDITNMRFNTILSHLLYDSTTFIVFLFLFSH